MSDQPQTSREAAVAACYMLCEVFGKEATDNLLRAWKIALADLSIAQIEACTARAIQEMQFMPRPAEFRKLATGGADDAEAMAHHAYSQVERAAVNVGGYRSPDFEDPIINATIRHLGGWVRITELPESEFDLWFRKDFIATYKVFYRHPPSPEACAPLTGLHFKENGAFHQHDQQAKLAAAIPLPLRLADLRGEVDKNQKFLTDRPEWMPTPKLKRIGN